ncbi:MAG: bifunctional phosphoribosylaminoimidazolecarboxamide formyltransferase/IMP cyclohydrolase [Acidobacteriaceae bacterium]|nr:bifunctional phosphoribosylaminoimidazolecarboxamide formyltransferase/IMP cyclohydrolase [Acidobacteriaceae bacterium]
MPRIAHALLSVTDKTGIVDFARKLHNLGIELISTGGTAKLLGANTIPVREVAEVTGFPEMLDGRVKTLHPKIAGGILAIRSKPEHMQALSEHDIPAIQMVIVNLYQFEKYAEDPDIERGELIENIDIGGPTMIRAAAKNFGDVAVVVTPEQYTSVLEELERNDGALSPETNWKLAQQAFEHTAAYDRAIASRLSQIDSEGRTTTPAGSKGREQDDHDLPAHLAISATRAAALRYGENPHQKAALYRTRDTGVAAGEQLGGKELSYNNLVDLDAAWQLVSEFESPACAIIKHTNPCGCAEQLTLANAYRKALEADPVSAFGGILAFNREVNEETAAEVSKLFVEAIAAPGFSEAARSVLAAKKNLRLLEVKPSERPDPVLKSITGGFLLQTADTATLDAEGLRLKTTRSPSALETEALLFAWTVCKHVKSNAIVYARPGQTISVGAGQTSRVDSVKLGAMKAVLPLEGSVLASDAFFPFADGVEEAARHGVTAVIQPGGSVRDEEVIAAANKWKMAMLFTGIRHFRH